ncbi:MAG: hypothetical protein DWP97_00105 [Calditrichaeota bacterium]|nr:MAG: hypothetical protein DWP97_00105 [Calditrichota bacterium]
MDFSQEFLMDMAINGAGFLTAALIGMVFYALFSKKKAPIQQEVIEGAHTKLSEAKQTIPPVQKQNVSNVKFIQLGSSDHEIEQVSHAKKESVPQKISRKEVIQLARKMLDAGSTTENIKRILPVSDAELALLSLNNK